MGRPAYSSPPSARSYPAPASRAAAVLNRLGYDTVSEEDFPTGYGELRRWLAEQIDGCEGVIQLVGEAYGPSRRRATTPTTPGRTRARALLLHPVRAPVCLAPGQARPQAHLGDPDGAGLPPGQALGPARPPATGSHGPGSRRLPG